MEVRIKVTICPENALWVGIFERSDNDGFAAARVIFGKEPTDPELYTWLLAHYDELKFSAPQNFKLLIKRKNPKRMLREVKKELEKVGSTGRKESFAQEAGARGATEQPSHLRIFMASQLLNSPAL